MNNYIIEGGIGRNVFFSALIPKLAEKEPQKKIMVTSSYADVFENSPYVKRSLSRGTPYTWEDVVLHDNYKTVFADPYFNDDFIKRKIHVIEAWCNDIGIEYTKDMKPAIYFSNAIKDNAKKFRQDVGPFIIVQFGSGQSPLNANLNVPFQWTGFQRNYPVKNAEWLIKFIREEYPGVAVVIYGLPNEGYTFEGLQFFQFRSLFYAALLEEAETFIGINSSLTHYGGALNKKGIVLWGGTSHKQWGYEIHNNLYGSCISNDLCCSRPYLRDLGDFNASGDRWVCPNPTCMDIDAEYVFNEFKSILTDEQKIKMKVVQEKKQLQQTCVCANDREIHTN